ncbi:hypothetical protein EQG49_11075 [Periweissella cryptocerci]|uniref:Uncharacterized protein n=1 Tax=Periweissella cryptocerci TaxID=2506420 RepID=A0A4P6YVW2_9LACO|nr:hypothetical protein [Periweissella cryptocerci]QBO36948.1 hypothetical protein EQG49_11075 [Periweissella cryptocerci]
MGLEFKFSTEPKVELTVSEQMQKLWNSMQESKAEAKKSADYYKAEIDKLKRNAARDAELFEKNQRVLQGELQALMGDAENIDAGMGMEFRYKRFDPKKSNAWKVRTDGTAAALAKKYRDELEDFIKVETKESLTIPLDPIKKAAAAGELVTTDGKTINTVTGEILPGIELEKLADYVEIYKG